MPGRAKRQYVIMCPIAFPRCNQTLMSAYACVCVYVTFFYIRLQTKSIIVRRITTAHEYAHPMIDPASQEVRFIIAKTETGSDTRSRSDRSRESNRASPD